jgi:hypothetical protein
MSSSEEDAAGRFYGWSDDEIRVIDIALLPSTGERASGTLLRELQAEAARQSRPIIIHMSVNPQSALFTPQVPADNRPQGLQGDDLDPARQVRLGS